MSCGSIRTRAIKGGVLERMFALLLNQQILVCNRCGWRGRRRRSGGVARSAHHDARGSRAVGAGGAAPTGTPIDLTSLDRDMNTDVTQKPRGGN
jgi:hypothetical protein